MIIIVVLITDLTKHDVDAKVAAQRLFVNVGLTLGLAAAVELAYTLFTHGADEAVDPIMLGVAAALLVQLGQVDKFDLKQAKESYGAMPGWQRIANWTALGLLLLGIIGDLPW